MIDTEKAKAKFEELIAKVENGQDNGHGTLIVMAECIEEMAQLINDGKCINIVTDCLIYTLQKLKVNAA